jgi:hypothetical protein
MVVKQALPESSISRNFKSISFKVLPLAETKSMLDRHTEDRYPYK